MKEKPIPMWQVILYWILFFVLFCGFLLFCARYVGI